MNQKDLDRISKDLDNVFKDMDNVFKKLDADVDKVFKQMDDIIKRAESVPRKIQLGPWQKWFAWRPVTIKGRRIWLKSVYRRRINTYVDHDDWARYEYGDMFDILKDE